MKPWNKLQTPSKLKGALSCASLVGGLIFSLTACDERPSTTSTPSSQSISVETRDSTTSPTLRETVREIGHDMKQLGDQVEAKVQEKINSPEFQRQREEFSRSAREDFDKLKASIDRLQARAQVAGEKAGDQLRESIQDLRVRSHDADDELAKLKDSSVETWEVAKERSRVALERLKEAVNKAGDKIHDEVTSPTQHL